MQQIVSNSAYRYCAVEGKVPFIKGWQNNPITAVPDRATGLGILTGEITAVDVDCLNLELSKFIKEWLYSHFAFMGQLIYRYGNRPKFLVPFRSSDPDRKKCTSAVFIDTEGRKNQIEVLGKGQQFVAYGIHPDTGSAYQWEGTTIFDIRPDQLPLLPDEQVDRLFRFFEDKAVELGLQQVSEEKTKADVIPMQPRSSEDQALREFEKLCSNYPKVTLGFAADLLDKLDPDIPYDDWRNVGMALKDELGDDGFNIFNEWSAKGEKYCAGEMRKKWNSFKLKQGGVTFGTLIHLVKQAVGEDQFKKIWQKHHLHPDSHWLLNHVVVLASGSLKFYDLDRRATLTKEALDTVYGDLQLVGHEKEKSVSPSRYLASSNEKKVASGTTWIPSEERLVTLDGELFVNTYRPIKLQRKKGDVSSWLSLMKHVFGEHTDLVMDHMAFSIQHPAKKITWGILVIGAARTGKSLCLRPLLRIFGRAGQVISPDETDTKFDDIYAERKLLVYEELYKPSDKNFFNKFKLKLTNDSEETLNIKCRGMLRQRNFASVYAFTNEENCVQVTKKDEEKLLVVEGPDGKISIDGQSSDDFYAGYVVAVDEGELANHVYDYLLSWDVSQFGYGVQRQKTPMFKRLLDHSKPDFIQTLEDHFQEGAHHLHVLFQSGLTTPENLLKYVKGSINNKVTHNGLSNAMKHAGYRRVPAKGRLNAAGKKISLYVIDTSKYEQLGDMEIVNLYLSHGDKNMDVDEVSFF